MTFLIIWFLSIWSHHPSRLGCMSGSAPPGSSAWGAEMLQGHCTSHRACIEICRPPCCQPWRLCTVRIPLPSWPARTHSSSPYKRSVRCWPCSPWSPAYVAGGRCPSWFWHSNNRSWCKTRVTHPPSSPAPWHCTMGTGRVRWHCHPASLGCVGTPHPPKVGWCAKTALWMAHPSEAQWHAPWHLCILSCLEHDGTRAAVLWPSVPTLVASPLDYPVHCPSSGLPGEAPASVKLSAWLAEVPLGPPCPVSAITQVKTVRQEQRWSPQHDWSPDPWPGVLVYWLGGQVPQHHSNTPATILELSLHPHDVQSIRYFRFVIRVGCLRHHIQMVPHHHSALGLAVDDDGLKTWYQTLVNKQYLLIQVSWVLCSICWVVNSFTQNSPAELETLCAFICNPGGLPLHWGIVDVWLFHSLNDSINSGSAQNNGYPSRKPAGVI